MKRFWQSALFTATVLASGASLSSNASAQAELVHGYGGTRDYGTACLSPNDDSSSNAIDLRFAFPDGLRFFGETHTRAYVNTNGNVTFSGAMPTYTPRAFPVAGRPMIAPYWADVDIRSVDGECIGGAASAARGDGVCHNPEDNGVWWNLEPGRMVVTWDQVGYYACKVDKRMSFQLILSSALACDGDSGSAGDFDVEFRYAQCEWTTGDASSGRDGLGGTAAQAGFDAGNLLDYLEIPGSRTSEIHNLLCSGSNVGEAGVWRFEIRKGEIRCPDAGVECATGLPGVCAEGRVQCGAATGSTCQPVQPASDERCDGLDNDCDGETDEGTLICPDGPDGDPGVCRQGECTHSCFEGGCREGYVCGRTGFCVEAACDTVRCEAGEHCEGGRCVGPCDGVTCPMGLQCRAGRCLDLCASLSCNECSTCDGGECVPRCPETPCPYGQACTIDGQCVDRACTATHCEEGTVCRAGHCIDACEGATCPWGEVCVAGACVEGSAGSGDDAGVDPNQPDGGDVLETPYDDPRHDVNGDPICTVAECGSAPPRGCGCIAVGQAPVGGFASALYLLAIVVVSMLVRIRSRARRAPRPR